MRNTGFSAFMAILFLITMVLSGCQDKQAGDSPTTGSVSKRDRLVGNENLRLTTELQACRQLVEKQKQQLAECEQQKQQIMKTAGETADFLLKELPEGMAEEVTRLNEENKKLLERIAQLKQTLKKSRPGRGE